MTTIEIDPEFAALLPPLTVAERDALEASLLAEGCRQPLVVWSDHNLLVDGHHRYAICQRHGIPFEVIETDFDSRETILDWMIHTQLGRRNVTPFARVELALKLEAVIAAQARENQIRAGQTYWGGHPRQEGLMNSTKALTPTHTRQKMAVLAGTSQDTVRKVKAIKADAPESLQDRARQDEISIHGAFKLTQALAILPECDRGRADTLCSDDVDKVAILTRLYRSMTSSSNSNETYAEILHTGGFHHGEAMTDWCDFQVTSVQTIDNALQSIAAHHRRLAGAARREVLAARSREGQLPDGVEILGTDFRTWMAQMPAASVDLIVTAGRSDQAGAYETLAQLSAQVLRPGGSLLCAMPHDRLAEAMSQITPHLRFHWLLATQRPRSLVMADQAIVSHWQPVLWFFKGEWAFRGSVPDWLESGINGLDYLIQVLTQPDAVVLDPLMGDSQVLISALKHGCRVTGLAHDSLTGAVARTEVLDALKVWS